TLALEAADHGYSPLPAFALRKPKAGEVIFRANRGVCREPHRYQPGCSPNIHPESLGTLVPGLYHCSRVQYVLMNRAAAIFVSALLAPVLCLAASPFAGRWDFTVPTRNGNNNAYWLGISEKNGALDVWFQPSGGNVIQIRNFKQEGSHLSVTQEGSHLSVTVSAATAARPATTWELDAAGGKLTGSIKSGATSTPVTGIPAPELKRAEPRAWTAPVPLFNGKDLTGWEPIGNVANNHWIVQDGLLVNQAQGANLRSKDTYTDFKVHFEV